MKYSFEELVNVTTLMQYNTVRANLDLVFDECFEGIEEIDFILDDDSSFEGEVVITYY